MPLLEGYATGLALIVLIGPVLFVLLQSTLERGRAHGFAVAVGIFVSDVVAVALCTWGVAAVFADPRVHFWLTLGGGVLLLGFGIRYVLVPAAEPRTQIPPSAASLIGFFSRGFVVNFVNPFVFMVWLGILGAAATRHGHDIDLVWFASGAVLGVFTLDTAKVLLAHRIRPLLQPRTLRVVYRVSGVLLIGFGIRLIVLAAMAP